MIVNLIAIFYHICMFYFEGGFNMMLSSRLFWLGACFIIFLVQINIITFAQIIRAIAGRRIIRRNETLNGNYDNEKITDYFKPIAKYLVEEYDLSIHIALLK